MKRILRSWLILALLILISIAGCGGGGGSAGGGSSTVSGVATAGVPLVGTVYLRDSSNPVKGKSGTIAEAGSYSIDVTGLTAPFILEAVGTVGSSGYTLHSFSPGAGTANLNPFSDLAVALASGGLDPAIIFAVPSAGTLQTVASKLSVTITDIQTKLQVLLALYDAAKQDPLTGNLIANHTGLDEVMDMVSVDISAGTVTIRNKATNAVIFTCQTSNFSGGSVDASKIPSPPVRAVISPIFKIVGLNKSVTFTADVLRSSNKAVTWSVVEAGGGTITSAGVYTATSEGTYHIKATSAVQSALPAIAIVKVIPDNVIVDITPKSDTVASGGNKAFSAMVTGTINTQVTWSVVESGGGTIISGGVYFAPSAAGTYHVKATSVADPAKSDTETVTVTPAGVAITPVSASMTTGASKVFSAMVTGTSNTAVTWSVVEPGGGSITSSGTYYAPSVAGTYHVKATSVVDSTKSATAVVTVSAPKPFPVGIWAGPNGVSFTVSSLVSSGLLNQYAGSVIYSGGTITASGTDPMNQILGGSGMVSFVVSRISGTSGLTITFGSTSATSSDPTQITGVLGISNYPPSSSDYINMNAVFTKQ